MDGNKGMRAADKHMLCRHYITTMSGQTPSQEIWGSLKKNVEPSVRTVISGKIREHQDKYQDLPLDETNLKKYW